MTTEQENLLLQNFNTRDTEAFASVYRHFFKDLYIYASNLYSHTNELTEDVVQDVFCYLWENTNITFDNCLKLKSFLYTAIRNKYFNYLDHQKVLQAYENAQNNSEEDLANTVFKNEIYTFLSECINLLPPKHAEVMNLYLTAYEPEEISQKLDISLQTVYNIRHLSIKLLKEKINGST